MGTEFGINGCGGARRTSFPPISVIVHRWCVDVKRAALGKPSQTGAIVRLRFRRVDDLCNLAWTGNHRKRARRSGPGFCGLMRWLAIGLGVARMHWVLAAMPIAASGTVRAIDGFDCGRIVHESDGRPHSPSRSNRCVHVALQRSGRL